MNIARLHILAGLTILAAGTQAATTLNGAEIFSKDTVHYGRWEIRMQVAATPGSVSSFFTYYNNSYMGLPEPWREIDIEILGKNGKGFQSNLITGDNDSKNTSEVFHNSTDDLSKGFHTYVLDWTPDSVVWRMDGVLQRKTANDQQVTDLKDRFQTYRMNLWASTSTAWVGKLDTTKLPVVQTVNWMSYSAYTPGAGPGGSNFTPSWTDDFTTWNLKRWSKGDWTFDGNMADFSANNAVVSGGYLMLILSKKSWSGSLTPPADPMGSTKPTSVGRRAATEGANVRYLSGSLLVDTGDRGPAEVVVASPAGQVLARRTGAGVLGFEGLPRGLAVVKTGSFAQRVLIP